MRGSKLKKTKNQSIKFIHKPFKYYVPEKQDEMKKGYELIIHDLNNFKKNINSFSNYVPIVKNLSAEQRTIIFNGVPVRLSYKQFIIIRILIDQSLIYPPEYSELDFSTNSNFNSDLSKNIKSFVSKLKRKIKKEITHFKADKNCNFSKMTAKEIKEKIDDLIFYEQNYNGYVLYTNFEVKKDDRVKKQVKKVC